MPLTKLFIGIFELDSKALRIGTQSKDSSLTAQEKKQLLLNLNSSLNGSDSFNGSEVWAPPKVIAKETSIIFPSNEKPKLQPASSKVPNITNNSNKKTLKMTKENVTLVQKALNKAGFYTGEFNGILDASLLAVIKDFQKYVDLEPDGLVDVAVIKYLDIYSSGCESAYALKISISNL